MTDAVAGFFANGGLRCFVVRVAHEASTDLAGWDVPGLCFLEAKWRGAWAHRLRIRIQRTGQRRFNLVASLPDSTREFWGGLSTSRWIGDRERGIHGYRRVLLPASAREAARAPEGAVLIPVPDVAAAISWLRAEAA